MGRLARIRSWIATGVATTTLIPLLVVSPSASAAVTREEVERAIREGVRYLKNEQRADGSWVDVHGEARTGTVSRIDASTSAIQAGSCSTQSSASKFQATT